MANKQPPKHTIHDEIIILTGFTIYAVIVLSLKDSLNNLSILLIALTYVILNLSYAKYKHQLTLKRISEISIAAAIFVLVIINFR